jgi:hypothetical protein
MRDEHEEQEFDTMAALRARVGEGCLETMTQRIEQQLHQKQIQLRQREQVLDEAEWMNFLHDLKKGEREFVRAFLPEIRDRLARLIVGQPLEAVIRENHGQWPLA